VEELAQSAAYKDNHAARRAMLCGIFAETLQAVAVREVFARGVRCEDCWLRIVDLHYHLSDFRRVLVIAIGKAAVPSAEVVLTNLATCKIGLEAIVVGPGEMRDQPCVVERWQGSHPLPDMTARDSAHRIMGVLKETSAQDLVIFLISGGASAMLELPLDPSLTVEETAAFYRALVHSGLNISEMNTLRKHFSAVKGGRLAELAPDATKCTLLISDVPEGMADVIGSGPTLPDSSTREQCWALLRRPELQSTIPERVRTLLESASLPETPKQSAACFRNAKFRVVLSTATMLAAAAQSCERQGFHVVIDNSCDDWEYRAAADYLLERLRNLSIDHARVCLLSAGEVLVKVGKEHGTGGRNQQFALYCAKRLDSIPAEVVVLSAGTDGVDGDSPAAGAVVDGTTVERALRARLSVEDALEGFDAYPLLAGIGDAIVTGPTGNNVRDLRILVAERR
jgi:glycerate 2-kinase